MDLILDEDRLKQIISMPDIGSGTGSKVWGLDSEIALKISKRFLESYDYSQVLEDSYVDVSKIRQLQDRQQRTNVQDIHLPQGIIYYRNVPIGSVLTRFNSYQVFSNIHHEEIELILENYRILLDKITRMMDEGIYNADLSSDNVLYKGNDVQPIDLEDQGVAIRDQESLAFRSFIYSYFTSMLVDMLNSRSKIEGDPKSVYRGVIDSFRLASRDSSVQTAEYNIGRVEKLKKYLRLSHEKR